MYSSCKGSLDRAKSTTTCITSLHVVYKIILPDFNLAVSTSTAKLPNLILCQIFRLYGISSRGALSNISTTEKVYLHIGESLNISLIICAIGKLLIDCLSQLNQKCHGEHSATPLSTHSKIILKSLVLTLQ